MYGQGWSTMTIVVLAYTGVFLAIKFLYFERLYQLQSERLYRSFNDSKQEMLESTFETIVEMLESGVSKGKIR